MNTIDIIGLVFAIVALLAFLVLIIVLGVMLVNDTEGTSKAAKFRIEPLPKKPYGYKFAVQRKRWWGWQTVYSENFLGYCEEYIKDMSKVRKVEWIKD